MKNARGFTLIEVLVAMAITAIVSVLAYSGLDSAVKLSRSAEIEADRLQKMNRVFDILQRDFRQVISRPVRNPDGETIDPAFMLSPEQTPLLSFTRAGWVNPDSAQFQRSELQRVSYLLDDNKFKRFSWQMLDRYADSQPQEVVLLTDVKSFEVKVLSDVGTTDVNGQVTTADKGEWINVWPLNDLLKPGSNLTTLPVGIEIILDVEGVGRIRRVYEIVAGQAL